MRFENFWVGLRRKNVFYQPEISFTQESGQRASVVESILKGRARINLHTSCTQKIISKYASKFSWEKTFRIIMRFEHFWVGPRRKKIFDQLEI
jgi:hypothetical protein